MKILRVVTSMDPQHGGVVEAINQSARSFNQDNWQMDVLCFDLPQSDWVKNNSSYAIFAIGKAKTAYGLNFHYLSWLKKHAHDYDVVILDGLWQFLVFGGYLLKLMKIPYFIYTHGMLDPYFNEDRLKYWKKIPFWFFIERNVLAMAQGVIFTCEEEKKLARKSFPLFKATSKVATLGVEVTNVSKEKLLSSFYEHFPELKSKKFALFLSRIHSKKGIDLLIEAIGSFKTLPDNFMLVIAGPDNSNMQAELVMLSEQLGIKNKILWVGMLQGDIKWGAYYASDVFVLPSHQENFGIVVAEALSTSTPVLITNKVNIWHEIKCDVAGFVENDDVQGIEKLLQQWFELSLSEKQIMAKNSKACYQNNFSIEKAVNDLEKILLEVLD